MPPLPLSDDPTNSEMEPLVALDVPLVSKSEPDTPDKAVPVENTSEPLVEDVDEPVEISIDPELPFDAEPVRRDMAPDTPLDKLLPDRKITLPDDDDTPDPVSICKSPLILFVAELFPVRTTTEPPSPTELSPTSNEIGPEFAPKLLAAPVERMMYPLGPWFALPDRRLSEPEAPDAASPVATWK